MSDDAYPLAELVGRTITSAGPSPLGDRLTLDDGTNIYGNPYVHVVAPITGTGAVTLFTATITDGAE